MESKLSLLSSRLTKVNGERNTDFSGKISMNQNINIKKLEKFKPKNSKIESLKIEYSFQIDYSDLGKVEIEGFLFLGIEAKEMKKIISDYEKKKFDSPEHITIMNIIIQKASLRAFEIEDELGLPIHIKLPQLATKQ